MNLLDRWIAQNAAVEIRWVFTVIDPESNASYTLLSNGTNVQSSIYLNWKRSTKKVWDSFLRVPWDNSIFETWKTLVRVDRNPPNGSKSIVVNTTLTVQKELWVRFNRQDRIHVWQGMMILAWCCKPRECEIVAKTSRMWKHVQRFVRFGLQSLYLERWHVYCILDGDTRAYLLEYKLREVARSIDESIRAQVPCCNTDSLVSHYRVLNSFDAI